jgi:predicted DNA-binding protein
MQQAKKDDVLRVRLTSHYRQKLKRFAQKKGITESAVIREYIRRLPD